MGGLESEKLNMLKESTNIFFGNVKGIIVDNSYDKYVLNQLIKYYKDNKIEYLYSQDNDLSYLKHFDGVSFLSIPDEATNFDELNNLNNLRGLRLYSSSLKNIKPNILEKLEYLEIIYNDNALIDYSFLKALKHLRICNYPYGEINIFNKLESLEFDYCKKLYNLDFIKKIKTLKKIKLSFIPQLKDVSFLMELSNNLDNLQIRDCKKIVNLEMVLSRLTHAKNIEIITLETDSKMKIKNLSFMKNLSRLETFSTNYKIEDGVLDNLLKLKDANITAFYRHYNLKDRDLPHINVLIDDYGVIRKVKLDSLEFGKEDRRIIWLN